MVGLETADLHADILATFFECAILFGAQLLNLTEDLYSVIVRCLILTILPPVILLLFLVYPQVSLLSIGPS